MNDDERADADVPGCAKITAEEKSVSDISRKSAVFCRQIVRIGGQRARSVGIAISFSKHIVCIKRDVPVEVAVEIKNELVLIKSSA